MTEPLFTLLHDHPEFRRRWSDRFSWQEAFVQILTGLESREIGEPESRMRFVLLALDAAELSFLALEQRKEWFKALHSDLEAIRKIRKAAIQLVSLLDHHRPELVSSMNGHDQGAVVADQVQELLRRCDATISENARPGRPAQVHGRAIQIVAREYASLFGLKPSSQPMEDGKGSVFGEIVLTLFGKESPDKKTLRGLLDGIGTNRPRSHKKKARHS